MPPKAVQTPAPSTDTGDKNPGRPASKAKQKTTSKDEKRLRAKRLKSAAQPIQPLSSDPTNRALGPSSHLDLSNLGIIIDQTTENTSLFVDVFKNKGLKLEDTARKSHTFYLQFLDIPYLARLGRSRIVDRQFTYLAGTWSVPIRLPGCAPLVRGAIPCKRRTHYRFCDDTLNTATSVSTIHNRHAVRK
ncbi:hypothetical protein IG631_20586 [Alternaria alternata]|nr:hypothetical protein IG631_20586 [Alternaria alternata]